VVTAALASVLAVAAMRAAYVRRIEARTARRRPVGSDGLIPGAGPIDLPRAGAAAVLLIHGGGDTAQVMAGLARHLHEAGFAVRVPLLSGHGRALSAFRRVRATAWHDEVRSAYDDLCTAHEWVAVVGLSLGGALAICLAAERPRIPALVLLAPYVSLPLKVRAAALLSPIWGIGVPYIDSRGQRSIHDPVAAREALGHGVFTPSALRALANTVSDARLALPRVTAPTLVVQSRDDNRISTAAGEAGFQQLGSRDKELVWIDGAGHVITVDFGHDRVFALTSTWLTTRAASQKETAKDPMLQRIPRPFL
jgi:carboxylesterase